MARRAPGGADAVCPSPESESGPGLLGPLAPPFTGSVGYVGTSDGWQDLARHKRLTWEYDRAEDGNVTLTGEVDLAARGGLFLLAVGFGAEPAEAGHRALSSLLDDADSLRAKYARGWQDWQKTLNAPKPRGGAGGRDLFRISTAVLQTHSNHSIPRAIIASLSAPWGETRGDEERERGTGGYYPGKEVGQAFQPDKDQSQAGKLTYMRFSRAGVILPGLAPRHGGVGRRAARSRGED